MTNEKEECKLCGGVGKIPLESEDDLAFNWKQCVCSFTRGLRVKLGPEIATAQLVSSSPLFDLTDKNLHIKCDWTVLTGHLKYVLMQKNYERGLHYYCNIVTDERLKTVWLGDEAYKAKARKKREEVDNNNTLSDVVGASYDLVIIRLGFLGYKNIAMPGVLKEALMIRQGQAKATWVVEDPEFPPFTEGHFSWNMEVGRYIGDRFTVVDLLSPETKFADTHTPTSPGMYLDKGETPVASQAKVLSQPRVVDYPSRVSYQDDRSWITNLVAQ
jgi:hypothetical protein